MSSSFAKTGCATIGIILALLGLNQLQGMAGQSHGERLFKKVIAEMRNNGLNREDFDTLAGGYYEGLQQNAGPGGLPGERDDVRFRDDFRRYEFRPNVRRSYAAGMRITNSLGMPNPEYLYAKPAGTRRIAWFGDSISVGPYGQDFLTLLEHRLNQDDLSPSVRHFEILNFAVYGYSVLQMMDTALNTAPQFHPDVYVVALSGLELDRKAGWRTHVGRLIVSHTDLKYDYLKHVVTEAGVAPTDHLPSVRIKLTPYFAPVVAWALQQIQHQAESQGASMMIVMVPAPIDPSFTESDFNRLHKIIDPLGIPTIDLRDTFRGVDLDAVHVDKVKDIHPNVRGHEMIYENLYPRLHAQPQAWADIVGSEAGVQQASKLPERQ